LDAHAALLQALYQIGAAAGNDSVPVGRVARPANTYAPRGNVSPVVAMRPALKRLFAEKTLFEELWLRGKKLTHGNTSTFDSALALSPRIRRVSSAATDLLR
jgi:hypothetical protein